MRFNFMKSAIFGKILASAYITLSALWLQTAVPNIGGFAEFLIPCNTAIVALMWYRIQQLEKKSAEDDKRFDRLDSRLYRLHGHAGEPEIDE